MGMGDMAIGGIVSGIDTQEMVNQLLELERQPLHRLAERREGYQQEQQLLEETRTRMNRLQDIGENLKDSLDESNMVATSSDEDKLSATANENASEGVYNIEIKQVAERHILESTEQIEDTFAEHNDNFEEDEDYTLVFEAEGILENEENELKVEFSGDDTLEDLAEEINSKNIPITASVIDNRLRLTGDKTGEHNEIHIKNDEEEVAQNLGFLDENGDYIDNEDEYVELKSPQDAEFTVDGSQTITRPHNKNIDDVITGVTLNIDPQTAEESDVVTVNVFFDSAAVEENLQSFVEKYNEFQDFLSEHTKVDTHERGALADNPSLSRMESNLRTIMSAEVEVENGTESPTNLADLGITTPEFRSSAWERGERGHLELDINDFNQAFSEDPQGTREVLEKVMGDFDDYLDDLTERAGIMDSSIEAVENRISRVDSRMETMERRLERTEQRLWDEFTAMERALHRMQEQGFWMDQQMMGMSQQNMM